MKIKVIKYTFTDRSENYVEDIRVNKYFLKTNQDSAYTIITEPNSITSRGWIYKHIRIGDWYFENSDQLDSIFNYVNYCGGVHHINTTKHFKNNLPDYTKGKWHDFAYDSFFFYYCPCRIT